MIPIEKKVPKGALLLHTPWLVLETGDFCGSLKKAELTQCNHENEFYKRTPQVVERYLTWAKEPRFFDDKTFPPYYQHRHSLKHEHDIKNVIMAASAPQQADDDDGGGFIHVSSYFHSHDILLRTQEVVIGNDESLPPQIEDPVHREVNAYYAKNDSEIPLGALAFYVGAGLPHGWRDLAFQPLDPVPGENPQKTKQRLWGDCFLKIAGCWPSLMRKGKSSHIHFGAQHTHTEGGVAGPATGTTRIDSSSDTDITVGEQYHIHEVDTVGDSTVDFVGSAPNAPRNYGVRLLVQVRTDASWERGMMIPFIPEKEAGYVAPPGWDFAIESDPSQSPTHFRVVNAEVELPGKYYGEESHVHAFAHGHQVTLKPSQLGDNRAKKDEDETCCNSVHGHSAVDFIDSSITSGPGINILPNREVNFIKYTGVR